jgi:hypothetical protein
MGGVVFDGGCWPVSFFFVSWSDILSVLDS